MKPKEAYDIAVGQSKTLSPFYAPTLYPEIERCNRSDGNYAVRINLVISVCFFRKSDAKEWIKEYQNI